MQEIHGHARVTSIKMIGIFMSGSWYLFPPAPLFWGSMQINTYKLTNFLFRERLMPHYLYFDYNHTHEDLEWSSFLWPSATLIYVRITFAGHEAHSLFWFLPVKFAWTTLSLSPKEPSIEPSDISKEKQKHPWSGMWQIEWHFGIRE